MAAITIKVLGTGCAKCRKLEDIVRKVVAEDGLDAEVLKVEDIDGILAYGVMATPALVVDEQVVSVGRVPSPRKVRRWLEAAG